MNARVLTNKALCVKIENCFHEDEGYVLLRATNILLVGFSLGVGSVVKYTSSLILLLYSGINDFY